MDTITLNDLWQNRTVAPVARYPHLPKLIQILRGFIEDSQSSHLAAFQLTNAQADPVELICPTTGQVCRPVTSLVVMDKTVFIKYDGVPAFWLALSNMARGYPPVGVFVEDDNVLIKFDDPIWGLRDDHVNALFGAVADMAKDTPLQVPEWHGRNVLITGDQNFAHVLWNQLPAIAVTAALEDFADFRLVVTHESLAPIAVLLPEVPPERIVRLGPASLVEVSRAGGHFNNPGSLKIPHEIIERVQTACAQLASERALAIDATLSESHSPVIWLSLRLHDRTADNQHEFLVGLILRIFEMYDDMQVVLDGFSLPNDIDTNYDYPDHLRGVAQQTLDAADAVIADVYAQLAPDPHKVIHNACGMKIPDSLFLARHASFYVCHHGTVQHKVGWIANCLGFVHSNTEIVSSKPEAWAASMIEDGVRPVYIHKQFVRDLNDKDDGDALHRDLRLGNYSFVNLDELIEDIMATLELAIHRAY